MKTILNSTEKERIQAKNRHYSLSMSNKKGMEKAEETVERLGLGGFWKGYHLACLVVYDAMREFPNVSNERKGV